MRTCAHAAYSSLSSAQWRVGESPSTSGGGSVRGRTAVRVPPAPCTLCTPQVPPVHVPPSPPGPRQQLHSGTFIRISIRKRAHNVPCSSYAYSILPQNSGSVARLHCAPYSALRSAHLAVPDIPHRPHGAPARRPLPAVSARRALAPSGRPATTRERCSRAFWPWPPEGSHPRSRPPPRSGSRPGSRSRGGCRR